MAKKSFLKSVLWLFIMIFFSLSSFGIVEKLSLEKMTLKAARIILGTVTHTESRWEEFGRGRRIFTYVYIDVEKDIKGAGSRLIEIKVPGGKVGGMTESVSDVPQFSPGEKTLLFLRNEYFQVVGWYQGKFSVRDNVVLGPGIKVNDFVDTIQRIQKEALFGQPVLSVTRLGYGGAGVRSSERPFVGKPAQARLDRLRSKPGLLKENAKKEASDLSFSKQGTIVSAAGTTIMSEGFEGSFPTGLWTTYGDPTWGKDDFKPKTGLASAWCARGGASGLDPQYSTYANNMESWMIYGPFSLSDATSAQLVFDFWNNSESDKDYFSWMSSLDGSNFSGYKTTASSGGWQNAVFDLTDVCQNSSVYIGFYFQSDSANNGYEGAFVDNIVLQKSADKPNLTPYKPSTWADKIVVSNHTGDNNDDSPLYSTDTLYIDWAVANNGGGSTAVTFYSRLYVDDVPVNTWSTPSPFDPGYYAYVEDYSIGSLSAGPHTLKIVVDYDSRIDESNETDNEYQKAIDIVSVPLPNITNISPSTASAGTSTQVTISGTNFKAVQGSGKVEFFYKTGSPKLGATIDSWSDTQIKCRVPIGTVNGYPGSAGSGPVTVTTTDGTSNGYTFKVTFGYGNVKWPGTHPYVSYEINENTADCTGEGTAVIAAANEWNAACARYGFIYGGATTAADYSQNYHNEIMWAATGGSVATSHQWFSNQTMVECDMVFEDALAWGTDGSAEKYDIQNVATHEFGHWLHLRDLYGNIGDGEYDVAKTMYGFTTTGEIIRRSLHADDASGILWIYLAGGDEWDPGDDTAGGATLLTPTTVEQSHGRHTLTSSDNYDWFRVPMATGWIYHFRSVGDFPAGSGGAGDVFAELFSDSAGLNRVAFDDNSGGNLQFDFTYEPSSSQDYYLKIKTAAAGKYWCGNLYYKKEQAPIGGAKDDLLGTYDGQGVYFRNSETGKWVKLASPADLITTGDLEGDGKDDLIGIWPGQGGVWVRYSGTGSWAKLSTTAKHIAAGDMNGDGRVDLLGTWDGQGVFYRDSISGLWIKLASPATLITTGDLDGDNIDDLIGIWPTQGGVWAKYSKTGAWSKLSSSARDMATGDMNGDGRKDLIGTWDGQGVYYKNSISGAWVKISVPGEQVTAGDLDGDGTDDLIGLWASQGGIWVKYSKTTSWSKLSSPARDITAGEMRGGIWGANRFGFVQLQGPVGGYAEGPGSRSTYQDFSAEGPGGWRFAAQEEKNLVPHESGRTTIRVAGPGEPGFRCAAQKNLFPQEQENRLREKREKEIYMRRKS